MGLSVGKIVSEIARYAAFVEPEGLVREMVVAWKDRVARRWPHATYLAHPPHCTIWVGEVDDGDVVRRSLEDAAGKVQRFSLAIPSSAVFHDDVLAGGGQTCVFAATLTDRLTDLQVALCEALRAHRKDKTDEQLPAALRREPFLQSWRRYAFPFVGPHWIPHFTVASLPVRRDDPGVAEFLETMPSSEMRLLELSWWRITGERHERIGSLPLASS